MEAEAAEVVVGLAVEEVADFAVVDAAEVEEAAAAAAALHATLDRPKA